MRMSAHVDSCALAQAERTSIHRNAIVGNAHRIVVSHRKAVENVVVTHSDGVRLCARKGEGVAVVPEYSVVGDGVATKDDHIVATERCFRAYCDVTSDSVVCLVNFLDARAVQHHIVQNDSHHQAAKLCRQS